MAKKILFVDNDENLMHLLLTAFQSKGYEVHGISKGKEAIEYLSSEENVNSLSLLVLDRILDDMEGTEILRFFKEKYQDRVPVLMLTSLSAEKDVVEGLQRGAVDYLTKPFSVDVLVQKASQLIK